jgi:hypothetical protein
VVVGDSGDGSVAIANSWTTYSDCRLKKGIQIIDNALEKISRLAGYFNVIDVWTRRLESTIGSSSILTSALMVTTWTAGDGRSCSRITIAGYDSIFYDTGMFELPISSTYRFHATKINNFIFALSQFTCT